MDMPLGIVVHRIPEEWAGGTLLLVARTVGMLTLGQSEGLEIE